MSITSKQSRKQFAAAVVKQLRKHNIDCVLVGGSCVSIYTNEKHKSYDLDFISPSSHEVIFQALSEIGFKKRGRYFVHSKTKFFLEFPSGPLALGNRVPVKPEGKMEVNKTKVKMLSPTQSVMDRLSAWFHWNDRRSLVHAIWICERHPISLKKIKIWAENEGESEKFAHFLAEFKKIK